MAFLLWKKNEIALHVVDTLVRVHLCFYVLLVVGYISLDALNAETKVHSITVKSADIRDRDSLGKVAVTLRLMPEGDIQLVELKEEIEKIAKIERISEKPIAFGIKALEIVTLIDDSGGGTDKLEDDLANLDGVQSVEVIDIGLI